MDINMQQQVEQYFLEEELLFGNFSKENKDKQSFNAISSSLHNNFSVLSQIDTNQYQNNNSYERKDLNKQEIQDLYTYLNKVMHLFQTRGYPQLGELFSVRNSEAQKTLEAIQKVIGESQNSHKKYSDLQEQFAKVQSDYKMYHGNYERLKDKYTKVQNKNAGLSNQLKKFQSMLKKESKEKNQQVAQLQKQNKKLKQKLTQFNNELRKKDVVAVQLQKQIRQKVFKKKDKNCDYQNSYQSTSKIGNYTNKRQKVNPKDTFNKILQRSEDMNVEELVKENTQFRNTILMIHKMFLNIFNKINENIVSLEDKQLPQKELKKLQKKLKLPMITNLKKRIRKFSNLQEGFFNMPFSKSGIRITNTFKKNLNNLELNSNLMKENMLFYLTLLSEEAFSTQTFLNTKHHKKMPIFKKSDNFLSKTREKRQKVTFGKKEDNYQDQPQHSFISSKIEMSDSKLEMSGLETSPLDNDTFKLSQTIASNRPTHQELKLSIIKQPLEQEIDKQDVSMYNLLSQHVEQVEQNQLELEESQDIESLQSSTIEDLKQQMDDEYLKWKNVINNDNSEIMNLTNNDFQ